MYNFGKTQLTIALHALVIALVIVIAAWSLSATKEAVRDQTLKNVERHQAELSAIAELTGRNGADTAVAAIITDCPNRGRFEALLISLESLSMRERLELQQLFESCGAFYAERKALMVSRLKHEYDALKEHVQYLETLTKNDVTQFKLDAWQELVSMEERRSDLLMEQVTIQQEIITLFIGGGTARSPAVSSLVLEANDIRELLEVLNVQITDLRNELVT